MPEFNVAIEVVIANDLTEARRIQTEIEEVLYAAAYGERDVFCAKLALEEALVNAVKHGNKSDPTKHVVISYHVTEQSFQIQIRDEGEGFDPASVPDPTAPENIERPCGRGLLLISKFMTKVDHAFGGNCIIMTKHRTPEA